MVDNLEVFCGVLQAWGFSSDVRIDVGFYAQVLRAQGARLHGSAARAPFGATSLFPR